MSINYSSAIPENNKASYGEFDSVDFVLTFANASLKLGSLRLEGELEVITGAGGAFLNDAGNTNDSILYDKFVGAHGLCESIQTEMLGEVYESIGNYPRMVKQYAVARNNVSDLFNSDRVCEMRVPYDEMGRALLKGIESPVAIVPPIRENPDFSIKIDTILNSSVEELPYSKSGAIKVSVNLARNIDFFHGKDVDATTKYSIKDLRLVYRTIPRETNNNPIVLRRRFNITQSVQSSLANIQSKVPSAAVEAFTATFQEQAHANQFFYNNTDLDKIPTLRELTFLFNDQSSANITYEIKKNSVVVDKFIEALGDTHKNSMAVGNMNNNNGYGVGLRMSGGVIDLRNQKFSVQINSDISNVRPLLMHMFFHTIIEV